MIRALVKAAAGLAGFFARGPARRSFGAGPQENPVNAGLAPSLARHPWVTAGMLLILGLAAALLVIVSGIVPIKASSGHWAITATLLDFIKQRSVATHSLGIQPPSLDDPVLILRGAAHYASGCYPCHGGPGTSIPPVITGMTPTPPELSDRVARWTPGELFSIVKHGIKFTGMPAWPAPQRDDEVWAVVAFLRTMPRLDASAYRRLAHGEREPASNAFLSLPTSPQPPPAVRDVCVRCHGLDGTGRGSGAFPVLAGQRAPYLYASLRAFADRTRFSGIMRTIAANLDDETMRDLATYYEALPMPPAGVSTDEPSSTRGEVIARRGIPGRDVPPCAHCHGPSENPKNPAYPILAGQHPRYLTLQLELFKAHKRGGSGYANLMHTFVDRLGAEEIRDVTHYYGSGTPAQKVEMR